MGGKAVIKQWRLEREGGRKEREKRERWRERKVKDWGSYKERRYLLMHYTVI